MKQKIHVTRLKKDGEKTREKVRKEGEKTRDKVDEAIDIDDPTGAKRAVHKAKKVFNKHKGAIIGGALSAPGGAIIGNELDK